MLLMRFVVLLAHLAQLPSATARLFTVVNTCPFTIWHVSGAFPSTGVVLTRGLLLAGPPYVFRCPVSVCARQFLNHHRYTPTSAKEQLYRLSQQGTSRLRFQHLLTLRTTNSRHLHPICRWESPPATSVQFGVPDNWRAGRIWVRCFLSTPRKKNSTWLFLLSRAAGVAIFLRRL
jgi:hypothetical protein